MWRPLMDTNCYDDKRSHIRVVSQNWDQHIIRPSLDHNGGDATELISQEKLTEWEYPNSGERIHLTNPTMH